MPVFWCLLSYSFSFKEWRSRHCGFNQRAVICSNFKGIAYTSLMRSNVSQSDHTLSSRAVSNTGDSASNLALLNHQIAIQRHLAIKIDGQRKWHQFFGQ